MDMTRKQAHIITLANIKGGVGKTTATVNIAFLLSRKYGKRVLVVDADDQGNAGKALGIRENFDRDAETLWYALNNKRSYKDVIVESPHKNIWVIPATKELKGAQLAFGQSARGMKLFKKMFAGVENDFDFVLIDTKPQVNILLQAALAASNWYLIPSFPESDSYDGFIDLIAECEEIRDAENEQLACLGVLFTCLKKSAAHETYLEFVRKHLRKAKINCFNTAIRTSNAVASGSLSGLPAVALSSSRSLLEDYLSVTEQIVKIVSQKNRKKSHPDLRVLGLEASSSAETPTAISFDLNDQVSDQLEFNKGN
jgi:chromosome partitioning protein